MADETDTVGKATRLLGLLGERAEGATLSQLSRASGYPLSSTHRLLSSLRRDGFVAFDEASKRYDLGLRLFQLGAAVSAARGFSSAALPVVRELSAATGESALMTVLDGGHQLCVHHLEAGAAVGVRGETGRRGPLHATASGKALLAFAGHRVREHLLESVELERFTPRTTTSREALRHEVAAVGAQGFAVADEEHESGVRSIGVPVLGPAGAAVAALAVATPAYRTTVSGAQRFLPPLREAADRLAVLLPHR
jgi:DNA-binding IclR family transcriptional regulator